MTGDLEAMRDKAMKESGDCAEKERFGLFTQANPLGMGDCNYNVPHHARDENGVPITEPRNFVTNPGRMGKGQEVYFSADSFLNKEGFKDPYVEYSKIHRGLKTKLPAINKDSDGNPIKPEAFYTPTNKWNEYRIAGGKRMGVPYENQGEDHKKERKDYRDPESGGVVVGPPNVLAFCNRPGHYNSTYGHTINKYPEYIPDKYQAGRQEEFEARKKWQLYYKESDKGYFKSMNSKTPYVFTKDQELYANTAKPDTRARGLKPYKGVAHEDPFKPSNPHKRGKLGCLNPFLRLIPDPTAIHKAKRQERVENPKDAFKPSRSYVTRPTPSISTNMMNLRPMIKG